MIVKTATGYLSFPARTTVEYKAAPNPQPRPSARPRLLVIDPDEFFLQFILQALSASFEVFPAHDMTEALRLLRRHNLDLLIIDLGMPLCDGIQIMQESYFHHRLSKLPMLVMSTSVDLRKHIADGEILAVVPKPGWRENLSRSISEALDRAHASQREPLPPAPEREPAPRRMRRSSTGRYSSDTHDWDGLDHPNHVSGDKHERNDTENGTETHFF